MLNCHFITSSSFKKLTSQLFVIIRNGVEWFGIIFFEKNRRKDVN